MKILLVSPVGEPTHIRKIPAALARDDKVVLTVIAPEKVVVEKVYDPSGLFCFGREEYTDGYRLIPVPLKDPHNLSLGFQSEPLRLVIKNTKPDIIQVWAGPTAPHLFQVVNMKLRVWRKSQILFYGFDNLPIHPAGPLGIYSRLKWRAVWTQVAGGVEADSEGLENLQRAGFHGPAERIFWGIPTDLFRPMDKLRLKQELKLMYDHIVGYVGRLVPEKGLLVLLAAVRQLPTTVHSLIIGDGLMRAELELWSSLPDLRERIHLLDAMTQERVVEYINCMDVLTLPSLTMPHWKEQYGRVIGEAMACGVPIVGSNSGAIPEVIGSAGLITTEGNVSALVEAFQTAIFEETVRNRLIHDGLQRAEQELSIRAMSQRLLNFYSRILEKKS
jgi:glycosyltransferase involved in cell wall biosynthesis